MYDQKVLMKWKAAELFPGKYITSLLTIYAMHEKLYIGGCK